MVLRLLCRTEGNIHVTRELGVRTLPASLGDVGWDGGDGTRELISVHRHATPAVALEDAVGVDCKCVRPLPDD